MGTTPTLEAGALWDAWCVARDESPAVSLEAFVGRYGVEQGDALELLGALLAVEEQAPLPSLVRVLQPGEDGHLRFAGFRLLHELGEGSAGIVFEAEDECDPDSRGHVAVKILNPVLGSGRTRREAILHEARITQELDHPSIVRVLGSGTERGYAWIATELIEGDSLGQWIDRERETSQRIRDAIEFGIQISSALEHAHGRGVLHRDLKPANVMVGPERRVKVLDFGLARREGAAFGVSHTGDVVGTPLYMAPEQLRGDSELDGRADLYALGLVLLELASGKRLLLRDDALKIMAGIAQGSGRLSKRYYAGLPGDLAGVLSRCLEPDRRDRYANARALTEDLQALKEGKPPRLGRLGWRTRAFSAVVRNPLRCAATVGVIALLGLGARWTANHMPLSVTIDSISARPTEVLVDGTALGSGLPTNVSFWARGAHAVELFDGVYRFPFELNVADEGARNFFLPSGPVYPGPQPLIPAEEETVVRSVGFVQLGVRAADHTDHHQSLRVKVSGPPGIDHAVGTMSTFPLEIRQEPYVLHIESEGFRPRDVPVLIRDGRTRSVMVELDRVESPWHTVLVSNPLDPVLDAALGTSDNLALRWKSAQRDSFTDGFVHRVGLGVVDASREGRVEFRIPLPCEVGELELLAFVNPEISTEAGDGQAILIEMGPDPEDLIPVLVWPDYPGVEVGFGEGLNQEASRELNRMMKEARATELHVRYRATGETVWLLRTNAMPRRTLEGGVHWEPTLVFRVRPPGTDDALTPRLALEDLVERRKAARVIELGKSDGIVTFGDSPSSAFVPFSGELVQGNIEFGSDLDGDGISDLAFALTDGSERVELRSGRDGSLLREWSGEAGDYFGHSLVFVPDMDGDGLADLLIGASQGSRSASDGPGFLRLVSGKTGAILSERRGERLRGGLGWSAAFVGDLDGSGTFAVISSTLEREAGGWGSAMLLSLPELDELARFQGREQFDFFGAMCASVGDVNADGHPDFAIGAPCEDAPAWDVGAAYVYSGDGAQGFPLLKRFAGERPWGKAGDSVGAAGDVDGDGHADWLVTHGTRYVTVQSGKTGAALLVFPGGTDHQRTTYTTARVVTDLDEDGRDDLMVPSTESTGSELGDLRQRAVVYSARSGEPLLELHCENSPASFNVAPAPDLDGDGRPDLFVGLGRIDGVEGVKLLFVLSGGR